MRPALPVLVPTAVRLSHDWHDSVVADPVGCTFLYRVLPVSAARLGVVPA